MVLSSQQLSEISRRTLEDYEQTAESFWVHTRDHDVSQNTEALLNAVAANVDHAPPYAILDFGCGPGRDLAFFRSLGHEAVGLDGCHAFVEHARAYAGCEVLEQDFLHLDLPAERFDGIFANASLFHVPSQELPRVLEELAASLRPHGILFSSNPRGQGQEGFSGGRYAAFHDFESWKQYLTAAGFDEVSHYYRPAGKPCAEQPWLASTWRKRGGRS